MQLTKLGRQILLYIARHRSHSHSDMERLLVDNETVTSISKRS